LDSPFDCDDARPAVGDLPQRHQWLLAVQHNLELRGQLRDVRRVGPILKIHRPDGEPVGAVGDGRERREEPGVWRGGLGQPPIAAHVGGDVQLHLLEPVGRIPAERDADFRLPGVIGLRVRSLSWGGY
jgi:hypothetical protein